MLKQRLGTSGSKLSLGLRLYVFLIFLSALLAHSDSSANEQVSITPSFSFASFYNSSAISSADDLCQESDPQKRTAPRLELNEPIERELAAGQKYNYQLPLTAGQYAYVEVEQLGIDVVARLYAPDGRLISENDTDMRLQGLERVEFIAETEGTYTVEIEPKYKSFPAGHYRIRWRESHVATAEDYLLYETTKLYRLGFQLVLAGKYDEAQSILERVLQVREKTLGAEHRDVGYTLNALANIDYYKGDFTNAELLYQRAIAIFEKTLGPGHPYVATCLNNLASLYQAKGDYTKSEVLHKRALELRERTLIADHPDIAQSLNNLANVYSQKGDYENAESLYLRAVSINEKIIGPEHINLAYPLTNLATVYIAKRDFDKAEHLLQRALAIREKKLGEDHPSIFPVLHILGEVYLYRLDYAKAQALFQRALAIKEKSVGPNHPDVAFTTNRLGEIYFFQNNYEKAEQFFQRALTMLENSVGPEHPDTIRTLDNLARLNMAKGDLVRAVLLQQRVIAESERNIDLNLAVGSERQKSNYLVQFSEHLGQAISLHTHFAPHDPRARDLAMTTILQRKGRIQDVLSSSLVALRSRSNSKDQELLDRFSKLTSQLANLVLNGPEKSSPLEHSSRIKQLSEQREQLESELSFRTAGFYRHRPEVSLNAIKAAIPGNAALVEFAVYKPFNPTERQTGNAYQSYRYIAYVLRRDGDVRWSELGEAKPIDEAIDRLRTALRDPKSKEVRQLARAVDAKVVQPVRALVDNATHLIISPDGELNLIPFEALVDESNRYLVERYSLTYLTSGRDLLRLQEKRESRGKPLIIANPFFGEPAKQLLASTNSSRPVPNSRRSVTNARELSETYFAPLAGTEQEARSIQILFPGAQLLSGIQASEAALKQATAPRLLHIATHGFFLEPPDAIAAHQEAIGKRGINLHLKIEDPLLRSGLALAGANLSNRTGEDGILTALEASQLNLWGTKLVTLSACDTGLGEIKDGEGVYGLRRAFVLAGAESLVMSLWPVSDNIARQLMTNYYKKLKSGSGRSAALREVQLEMLMRRGRQHPFYWASFIQSGDWANLDGKR